MNTPPITGRIRPEAFLAPVTMVPRGAMAVKPASVPSAPISTPVASCGPIGRRRPQLTSNAQRVSDISQPMTCHKHDPDGDAWPPRASTAFQTEARAFSPAPL